MINPIVSVIIPVYNVEPYIQRCLDSIINQTYRNLEIIVIDDGSPDRCGEICDEYAAKDERVIVIHKKNEGVRAARNDGIKIAKGKWITFVDADDWCDLDYYERFLSVTAKQAEVICASGYYLEYPQRQRLHNYGERGFLANSCVQIETLMMKITTYGLACDKMYLREFLQSFSLYYDITSKSHDDFEFNYKVYNKAKCFELLPIIGYHIRIHNTSITSGFNKNKPQEGYDVISKMYVYAKENHLSDKALQGVNIVAIHSIAMSLRCYYFHPQNHASYTQIAQDLREMKTWPYYHNAIMNRDCRGMNIREIVLRTALRLPWIWPVKLLYAMKKRVASL